MERKSAWEVWFVSTICFVPFLPKGESGESLFFQGGLHLHFHFQHQLYSFSLWWRIHPQIPAAQGCSALCHDKFIQHPQRAASEAISVMKLSPLNTHWWQIIPPPALLCVSHYSLFSQSGDSEPFPSPENRWNSRLFPALLSLCFDYRQLLSSILLFCNSL